MNARLAVDRVLGWEGSTRSIALLRIGCGLVIWAEYAGGHNLSADHDPARQAFSLLLILSAGFMAAGWFSRLATALAGGALVVGYHWFGVHLGMKGPYVHAHSYLLMMTVLMLALMPTGRSLSLDRWFALRRADRGGPPAPPESGALWPLALIRLQFALVYFWGAVDKTNIAFLSGSRLQQIFYYYFGSHEGMRIPGFDELMVVSSVATVALEYGLAFGLWFAPARTWLIPAGVVFHTVIYVTMPVGTFSVTSCLLYVAFFAPAAVHSGLARMLGAGPAEPSVNQSVPGADDVIEGGDRDLGGEPPSVPDHAG
jgi:hypothetical protein